MTFKKPQDVRSCTFKPEGEAGGNRRTPKDMDDRVGKKNLVVVKILSMQMRGKKGKEKIYYNVKWEGVKATLLIHGNQWRIFALRTQPMLS
jgi:hypothetical protein